MLRSRDYAVAGLILAATVTAVTLFSLRGGLRGSASSEQLEALKVVPQSAAGFMTLEVGALIDAIVDAPMGEVDPKALRKELAEVTRATLGVDLLAIRRATLFASISKKNIGVVLEGDFDGTLQGRAATGALDGVVLLPEGLHAALHGRSLARGQGQRSVRPGRRDGSCRQGRRRRSVRHPRNVERGTGVATR